MKKRRKGKVCLNCGHKLEHNENYFPVCGQENTKFHLSVGALLHDFVQN